MVIKLASPVKSVIQLNQRGYAFAKARDRDFSLSENPLDSPKVSKAVTRALPLINRYPKKAVADLVIKISRKFNLPTANISLGNGSGQLIDSVFRIIINPNDSVIIPLPAFFLFEKAAVATRAKITFIRPGRLMDLNIDLLAQKLSTGPKLVILANPNNPTGQIIEKGILTGLVKKFTDTLFVVDEANIEYGGQSLVKEASRQTNLLVLRTFSKGYGLAGLRVGLAISNPKIIKALTAFTQPFPVNTLAAVAAQAALDDQDFITQVRAVTARERKKLLDGFRKLGITAFPSQANSILIQTDDGKFTRFCRQNRVSVVDGSSFRGCGRGFFRINIQTTPKNRLLIRLLQKDYKSL